jgi:hypothetical protein
MRYFRHFPLFAWTVVVACLLVVTVIASSGSSGVPVAERKPAVSVQRMTAQLTSAMAEGDLLAGSGSSLHAWASNQARLATLGAKASTGLVRSGFLAVAVAAKQASHADGSHSNELHAVIQVGTAVDSLIVAVGS